MGRDSQSLSPVFGNLPLLSWLRTFCLLNYSYSGPICSQLLLCGCVFSLCLKFPTLRTCLRKKAEVIICSVSKGLIPADFQLLDVLIKELNLRS